jgi:hypothetical protein
MDEGKKEEKQPLVTTDLPGYNEAVQGTELSQLPLPSQPQPQVPPPSYYSDKPPDIEPSGPSQSTITQQPTPVAYQRRYGEGDHHLTLSIVMSFICCIFGVWWSQLCTLPAILYAIRAQEAGAYGDEEAMKKNHEMAFYCNVAAIAVGIMSWIAIFIIMIFNITLFHYGYYPYSVVYYG